MSFFRYFLDGLKAYIDISSAVVIVISAGIGALIYRGHPLIGAGIGAAAAVLFLLIFCTVRSAMDYNMAANFWAYGFTREFLEEYERRYIMGKHPDFRTTVGYAEALMRIGRAGDALGLLKDIKLPKYTAFEPLAAYYNIFIMSALKCGDVELAEKIRDENSQISQSARTDKKNERSRNLIETADIATEFYAGLNDKERLLNGYNTAASLTNTEYFHKYFDTGIYIWLAYGAKMLELDKELSELREFIKPCLEQGRFRYEFSRHVYKDEFTKAVSGQIPFV